MRMQLNTLVPVAGAKTKAKRVGRGIGCGAGKTCTRGHKGQKSRKGGYHKVGFEGGQMPLQRRLPKIGFKSRISRTKTELRLHELAKIEEEIIDLPALLKSNLAPKNIKDVKIIHSGKIDTAISVSGLGVTKGARLAIEAAGGNILESR